MHPSRFGARVVLGTLVLTACSAMACSAEYEDAPGTLDEAMAEESEQERLRKVILAADAPPPPAEQPPTQTGEETEIKTENGVAHDCSYKRYTGTALYETLASFDPNADTIWPGAVIQTKDLPQGLAAPIGLPRREGTITIGDASLGGGNYGKKIDEPSLAKTRDAIGEILRSGNVNFAAKSSYLAETAHSLNEAALKVGVSASWMSGKLKASFDGKWMNSKTTMVVRFIQAYYTVSFAGPPSPEKIFADEAKAADARQFMGPGNPPAYVSSVTYGRMLLMKVESNESESELRAALDAAYTSYKVGLDARTKKVLQNTSFTVFVLGGSPEDAAKLQASDVETRTAALAAYVEKGATFDARSPGVPISYTVRRLSNGQTLKVASTIDYQIPVCTPRALEMNVAFDRIGIGSDGAAYGGTTGEYEVWTETSDAPGGALPPTPGQEPNNREIVAKGTAGFEGGGHVPIGITRFVRTSQAQGATVTIGARVKTYANNKECTMTRQHGYRFNPQTNAGEWTNVGLNGISCSAKDTATFGNNSLSVTLGYTLTPKF